jgi:hypothetical protein
MPVAVSLSNAPPTALLHLAISAFDGLNWDT